MTIRQKRASILLGICLVCVVAMGGLRMLRQWMESRVPVSYEDRVLGVSLVADASFLAGKEKMACLQNPGVCYEDVLLPFDKDGRIYLSQDMEERWVGSLAPASSNFYLCAPEDVYWGRKQDAIREGHPFTLWLVGADCYYELELIVSGMPFVSIHTSDAVEAEPLDETVDVGTVDPEILFYGLVTMYYGTIDVFNPGVNTSDYEILQAHVRYHRKGASTYGLDKGGYALSLQNHKGQNVDVSLLGMRRDNKWKLNPMFNDPNRIREKTASQIWEQFDLADSSVDEAGPRMEYVEVVLDDCYQGIYCLVEPVDEKKFDLDRNDVLYKIFDWTFPTDEEIQKSVDNGWKMSYAIRLRYPEIIEDPFSAWYPMRDYLNTFYRDQELSFEEMASKVNIANIADKQMFVLATSAEDNYFKNTFFAAKVGDPGEYVMYQAPWDLDLTFGNRYDYNGRNFRKFDPEYTVLYNEKVMSMLLDANRDEMWHFLTERWKRYRKSFLKTEAISQLLIENRDYLCETGAILREKERWPKEEVDMDIDYLLDFQTKRMEWLDHYFGE